MRQCIGYNKDRQTAAERMQRLVGTINQRDLRIRINESIGGRLEQTVVGIEDLL